MPKFEFQVGTKVFEIDAADQASAVAKFKTLNVVPPMAPTPTEWGPADRPKPAPGHRPGPLGDLSSEAAMRAAAGDPAQNLPAAAAPGVSGPPAGPGPVGSPPVALPSGPDTSKSVYEQTLAQESLPNRLLIGAGSAIEGPLLSLKQLLGRDPSEDELKAYQAVTKDPAGMVGNIAGNIAGMAIPSGAAVKAIEGITKFPRLAKALAVPTVAAAEGATLTPVVGDESRAKNAATSAIFAKALQAATKGLTGIVRPSPEAEQLMSKGIQPTVAQGGEGFGGGLVKQAEEIAANIPYLGRWVKQGAQRTHEEAADVMAGRAQIPGLPHPSLRPGRGDFLVDLRDQYDIVKDTLLKGKNANVNKAFVGATTAKGSQELQRVDPGIVKAFEADMKTILPQKSGKISLKGLEEIDTILAERISKYADRASHEDRMRHDAYVAVRSEIDKLRNTKFTFDERGAYEDFKDREAHGKILEKALNYKNQGSRDTTAQNLIRAVEESTPEPLKGAKTGLFQDITEPLKKVVKEDATRDALVRRIAYGTAGGAMGLAGFLNPFSIAALAGTYGLGKVASTERGARYLMGGNQWQRSLAELLRRRGAEGTMATIGGTEGQRE